MSTEELTKFGVQLEDEGPHAFDPDAEWWNESWFWDWYDTDGANAGHCRIGIHPNQQRVWLWLFLYREGEWVAIEEPRLPLDCFDPAKLTYDRWGLRCHWDVQEPLASGRLHVEGFGRALSGPRTGMILPIAADLNITGLGPPHSGGRANAPGHMSDAYPASRFEQPILLEGTQSIDGVERAFAGRGERDHSWGPRFWNLEWTFLAVNSEHLRTQSAEARIPDIGRFVVGYMQRDTMLSVKEVEFDLSFADDDVLDFVNGNVTVHIEDGGSFAARLESITAAEIDVTHCFDPPQRSVYRRALVRLTPTNGEAPLIGWLESNRFVGGLKR